MRMNKKMEKCEWWEVSEEIRGRCRRMETRNGGTWGLKFNTKSWKVVWAEINYLMRKALLKAKSLSEHRAKRSLKGNNCYTIYLFLYNAYICCFAMWLFFLCTSGWLYTYFFFFFFTDIPALFSWTWWIYPALFDAIWASPRNVFCFEGVSGFTKPIQSSRSIAMADLASSRLWGMHRPPG